MKKILIVLFMCFTFCGCQSQMEDKTILTSEKIEELMLGHEYVIIDVRTKEEYDRGHLVDAINIPYDEIDENIGIDKNSILFVYCKSGNRSNIAYETLTSLGYEAYDLGGYDNINLSKEE